MQRPVPAHSVRVRVVVPYWSTQFFVDENLEWLSNPNHNVVQEVCLCTGWCLRATVDEREEVAGGRAYVIHKYRKQEYLADIHQVSS